MLAQIMSAPEANVSHGHRDSGNLVFSKIDNEVDATSPVEMIGSGAYGAGINKDLL